MQRREEPEKGKTDRHPLSEGQRGELWLYIFVSIGTVEFLLAIGGLLYAFINGSNAPDGRFLPAFPWLSYAALALLAPALILLAAHLADVGLFRPPRGFAAGDDSATSESTSADTKAASDTEWQNLLPGRLKKAYRIIKAAPLVVLLAGVIALGAALLTLDGFLSAIGRFADILIPHTRSIIICAAVSIAVLVLGVLLLNYRTRKLIAEYEYRREVLEKTGIIIIDKGTRALSADPSGDVPYVLVSGESLGETKPKALPATDEKPEQPQT